MLPLIALAPLLKSKAAKKAGKFLGGIAAKKLTGAKSGLLQKIGNTLNNRLTGSGLKSPGLVYSPDGPSQASDLKWKDVKDKVIKEGNDVLGGVTQDSRTIIADKSWYGIAAGALIGAYLLFKK